MLNFPHFKQQDSTDCGATCLRIISAHYGKFFSPYKLKEATNITNEGVSLLSISEAAEKIGYRSMGANVSFDTLKQAPLPCVIHWNQNHFVVVYKIRETRKGTTVYVSDPSSCKLKYSKEEFCKYWKIGDDKNSESGIVLFLEPTPEFYKNIEETEPSKISYIFNYLRPHTKLVVQLIIGLLIGSILQLVIPFLTQSIVDFGISTRDISYIYLILIAQMILVISSSTIEFVRGWILLHIGTLINISMVSDFLIRLMNLPMSFFETKMTGDIIQRIGDQTRIQDLLTNSSLSIIFSMFSLVIFSVVLLFYNALIFTIFAIGSILYVLWVLLFMKYRAELDTKNFYHQSVNQNNVLELINGMQEIKLNGIEQVKRWGWERVQTILYRLQVKSMALGQYQSSGAILINQTKNLVITAVVANLVIEGELTLGMMTAIQYIIGQVNSPVEQLISFIRQVQDAKLSLERLNEVRLLPSEYDNANVPLTENAFRDDIYLNNISFRYDKSSVGEWVLDGINLRIPANKKTAIVGSSGSGKTTLLKLLLGYYPVERGNILLGENNLDYYDKKKWRRSCGIVMQEGFIFSDTIANNIATNGETLDRERLSMACKMANIEDFINSLPNGYNTRIGSDGHGLSQGQRQRMLIARAIYKDPKIVLFDEATNSLDANNESVILNNLQKFFNGRTTIIIAHRLSTVRDADQIVVLEKGKIIEIGTHKELCAKKAAYYRLVQNQLEL